jgi:predicted DNA-binding WGR domain protein
LSGPVTLFCIDPAKWKHRIYKMFIAPSLFGEWLLVRERGHIGSAGQVRSDHFANVGTALLALQKLVREKLKRGYVRPQSRR